jgi:hypothetical protein
MNTILEKTSPNLPTNTNTNGAGVDHNGLDNDFNGFNDNNRFTDDGLRNNGFVNHPVFVHNADNPACNPPINLELKADAAALNPFGATANTMEVVLVGGPGGIPGNLVVSTALAANDKLKICHLNGYEHFERVAPGNVFTWTMRTKMAE